MISILIPAYNYVCVKLVSDLQKQGERLGCPYEILVADDGSAEKYKQENRQINSLPHCEYIELPHNVGRSTIRNILADRAQYDYYLFMDCDGAVIDDDFLHRYKETFGKAEVVCGGIIHPDHLPSPEVSLRYKYEKHAEPRYTAAQRMRRPYAMFRSFNFMISKKAFEEHPFDEAIKSYGYEDVLLGLALYHDGVSMLHIDNPLVNEDIEANGVFLDKTEEAMRTLYEHRDKLEESTRMLRVYGFLKRTHLETAVRLAFRMSVSALRRNLTGTHPSLCLYSFYKAGYFCHLAHATPRASS